MRTPTGDQRMAIRTRLDKSFDDSVTAYLDDMTGQRIAELVGVPRIMVEQIREAAYGPIRVTPELTAIRAEIATAKTQMAALKDAAERGLARIAELSSRVEKALSA